MDNTSATLATFVCFHVVFMFRRLASIRTIWSFARKLNMTVSSPRENEMERNGRSVDWWTSRTCNKDDMEVMMFDNWLLDDWLLERSEEESLRQFSLPQNSWSKLRVFKFRGPQRKFQRKHQLLKITATTYFYTLSGRNMKRCNNKTTKQPCITNRKQNTNNNCQKVMIYRFQTSFYNCKVLYFSYVQCCNILTMVQNWYDAGYLLFLSCWT